MVKRRAAFGVLLSGAILLQGCVAPVTTGSTGASATRLPNVEAGTPSPAPKTKDFATIVGRVEPVAEQFCRATPGTRDCDYRIVLDKRPGLPANAYQTRESSGRPLLVVNQALLTDLENADEIAFVISHEAAHHIADHIPRQQASTETAAIAAGLAAAALGGGSSAISTAQQLGAYTGSRAYSKNYELEADTLGAQIAYYAGYDPVLGVAYFSRARDPGDVFLGTHPPNAQRIAAVKNTMDRLN